MLLLRPQDVKEAREVLTSGAACGETDSQLLGPQIQLTVLDQRPATIVDLESATDSR